ncbi:AAA family ATPase [Pectobacterium jejuense]|uniref:AAA family ATPase n=1 Tax=Pectobacterium jejuense TaxID=2974022 RepID=UPI0032EFEA49
MIYSYGLKNYFGFKEGAEVSFALNNRVPRDISMGRDVSTIIGIKGANGSGKTNLLKALEFISSFCTSSFKKDESSLISADPYFKNSKPSEFYIDFKVKDIRYTYELGVTSEEVTYEKLYKKSIPTSEQNKKTRKVLVFERIKNNVTKRLDDLSSIDIIALKSRASLISSAYNYKFPEPLLILNDIYSFFENFITNVSYTGLRDYAITSESIYRVSEFYHLNRDAFQFAKELIIKSDLGISDVTILDRLGDDGKKVYFPMFSHSVGENFYRLTSFDESSGTKSLYVKLYLYWITLTIGGVLVLDEFDLNCHPFILPKLLELFESKDTNPLGAQFIFTSHITEVLDKLSKYRTYLVNKENNESYCYRLDEVGGDILRHGRPISPIYNEGKIGGVPRI